MHYVKIIVEKKHYIKKWGWFQSFPQSGRRYRNTKAAFCRSRKNGITRWLKCRVRKEHLDIYIHKCPPDTRSLNEVKFFFKQLKRQKRPRERLKLKPSWEKSGAESRSVGSADHALYSPKCAPAGGAGTLECPHRHKVRRKVPAEAEVRKLRGGGEARTEGETEDQLWTRSHPVTAVTREGTEEQTQHWA